MAVGIVEALGAGVVVRLGVGGGAIGQGAAGSWAGARGAEGAGEGGGGGAGEGFELGEGVRLPAVLDFDHGVGEAGFELGGELSGGLGVELGMRGTFCVNDGTRR